MIQRAAHRIDGHRRVLPEGQRASDAARKLAREHFIILPSEGSITYVRPHVRGVDKELIQDEGRPVAALGLATLMTFNDLHKGTISDCK